MKPRSPEKVNPTPKTQERFNSEVHKSFYNISHGDGTNTDNIPGVWANGTSPAGPDTEFAVPHNLNSIPVGFHVFSKNAAGDFYASATAWDTNNIFLKCSAGSVSYRIFIYK